MELKKLTSLALAALAARTAAGVTVTATAPTLGQLGAITGTVGGTATPADYQVLLYDALAASGPFYDKVRVPATCGGGLGDAETA
jgi:pyridoxal biosynthesis lyase PdxS